ncbi:MAG: hypothetical protein WA958_18645 [Tunicatimonas sp.]
MNQLFFWQRWHPDSRRAYGLLLVLLAVALIAWGVSALRGLEGSVDWELLSNVETVLLPEAPVSVGVFDFSRTTDYYVVNETYWGSNLRMSPGAAYGLLAALAITMVFLLVIISTFTGFWFYLGNLVVVALVLGMKWEQLQLFGTTGRVGAGVVVALFLVATFFFQKIRPAAGLLPRLLTFAALVVLVGLLVHFASSAGGAPLPHPALSLISYGLPVPIVLSLFFILLVGHELVSWFLKLITQNNAPGSKNTFLHFTAITVIYLANLGLLVLRNIGVIDWDILYLNAFLVLAICTVIGLWSFRDREQQYGYILPFQPLGAYLYASLALITFATLAFFFATANDPVLETFEDTIVYSQLGFGFIFYVYVVANFIQELATNQRVYRVVYQPPNLPYGTMQIVGLVATVAFFARAGLFPFYQAVAGYNNALGDLYQYKGDLFLAEQYYKLGDQYGYKNHRSNYALGALARVQNDPALTTFYFNEAVQKNPSPQAYVNLGNAFLETKQFFEAVFAFRQGLEEFPENPYLQNNLALTFGRTAVLDSALFYLQRAGAGDEVRDASEANTLAVLTQSSTAVSIGTDSLLREVVSDTAYVSAQVNALAFAQRYGSGVSPGGAPPATFRWQESADSSLNSLQFAHLYNYLLTRSSVDTALLRRAQTLAQEGAAAYQEPLSLATAVAQYRGNQVVDALRVVDRLQAVNAFKQGYYLHMMGLWTLEQQAPRIAEDFFARAVQAGYNDARFKQGVSLSEAAALPGGSTAAAADFWNEQLTDSTAAPVARDMLTIFSDQALRQATDTATDVLLYQALRYRYPQLDDALREQIWQAFDDPNYRVLALHDLWLRFGDGLDERWAAWADDLPADADLSSDGQVYAHWIAAFRAEREGDIIALKEASAQLQPLGRQHVYWLTYFRAKLAQQAGDNAQARSLYDFLSENPFFSRGYLVAINYLYPSNNDPTAAYQRLLDAVETNPYNAALLRAYVLAALHANLETYAEEGLADYRALVSEADYVAFEQEYERVLASVTVDF